MLDDGFEAEARCSLVLIRALCMAGSVASFHRDSMLMPTSPMATAIIIHRQATSINRQCQVFDRAIVGIAIDLLSIYYLSVKASD